MDIPSGQVVGRHAGVVLADVGERRDPGHITQRPDILGGAQTVVHLDPASRDLQAERVEPVDVRPPPRRDQQPVEADLGAVGKEKRPRRHAFRPRVQPNVDAVLAQRVLHQRRRIGVHA